MIENTNAADEQLNNVNDSHENKVEPRQQNKKSLMSKIDGFIDNNRMVVTSLVFGLLSAIIVLGLYIGFIANRVNKQIATVDIQSIMQDVTVKTFNQMSGLTPDKQSEVAKSNVTIAGRKLEQAMAIIAEKNNLVLVQKQALAYDKNVPDYTEAVKNEINLLK